MLISARPCSSANLRSPGRRIIVPSSLTTSHTTPTRGQARQRGQVDRGLGVTGADEDAAIAGAEREVGPRPGEVARGRLRVGQRPDRGGAVGGGDAGGDAGRRVDRDGVGGAHALAVLRGHQRNLEAVQVLAAHRDADDAAGVADREMQAGLVLWVLES